MISLDNNEPIILTCIKRDGWNFPAKLMKNGVRKIDSIEKARKKNRKNKRKK